jgi:hypothetical protein
MEQKDRSLYRMIVFLSGAGYAWLAYHLVRGEDHTHVTLCMFKYATGVPCPSCGVTRSLLSILHGNFYEAMWINPLGVLTGVMLVVMPAWVLLDGTRGTRTLSDAYRLSEAWMQKHKLLYIPLITLGLINWGWNILKDL